MSESIVLDTFWHPDAPDMVHVNEEALRKLVDIVEAHGFQVTLNKEQVPEP